MVAHTRQIAHEQVFHVHLDLAPDLVGTDQVVVLAGVVGAGQVVVPVWSPLDVHALAGHERARAGDGLVLAALGRRELLVVVGPGLEVVVDAGLLRVVEHLEQADEGVAGAQSQLAALEFPAAAPLVLVFPATWIADARPGLDVVEVHVFGALAVGPRVLAGYRARMAAKALVQVHDHGDLGFNPQANRPPPSCGRRP